MSKKIINEKNIFFYSGTVKLAGTIVFPQTRTEKCVILVSGSGMQDRDETFGNKNKTFVDISDYLVKQGIAVLRFDKRGCFESKGNYKKARIDDFANDVKAAVRFLSKEFNKIILLGHSEGGLSATLAAVGNKDVLGLILLAPVNEPVHKMIESQLKLMNKLYPDQMTPEMLRENKRWKKDINSGIYTKFSDYFSKKSKLPAWIKHANKINPQSPQYWRSLFNYDIRKEILKVKVPILIMNGKRDFMVDYKKTKKLFEVVKSKSKIRCELKLFPNLCHRFVAVKDLDEGLKTDLCLYWEKRLRFDKGVLDEMNEWIKKTKRYY